MSQKAGVAYFNYATAVPEKAVEGLPQTRQESSIEQTNQTHDYGVVRLRSKSVSIQPVRNPSGSTSYRVLGTIHPKERQRRAHCSCLEDAVAVQSAWEAERLGVRASLRPKITRLNSRELAQAEAATELLKGTGLTIVDAARHAFREPPRIASSKKLKDALLEFLAERRPFVGNCQYENLRLAGEQFLKFKGDRSALTDVATPDVMGWLHGKGDIKKKTWNNYRNDLSTFFEWCVSLPRQWLPINPVAPVPQHDIVRSLPERLEVNQAAALMSYLEAECPEWCVFFALALFAGIRPDMSNGEIAKLAAAVKRDGVEKYFCNDVVHITAEIAKDKRARQTKLPENALTWLKQYPVSCDTICPNDWTIYGRIRKRFKIPHDGLRHTAISAHVSLHGSFAEAASSFGNSETIIRTHYFNRMTRDEASAFYQILPTRRTLEESGVRALAKSF